MSIYWMIVNGLLPESQIVALAGVCKQFFLAYSKYKEKIKIERIVDSLADICRNDKIISWKKYYHIYIRHMKDYYDEFEYEISNAKHPVLVRDFFEICHCYPTNNIINTLQRAINNKNIDFVLQFTKIFVKGYPIDKKINIPKQFQNIELYLAFADIRYFKYYHSLPTLLLYKDPHCIQFLKDFLKVGPRVIYLSNNIINCILYHSILFEMPEFIKYYTNTCFILLFYSDYYQFSTSFKQLIQPYINFTVPECAIQGKINTTFDYNSVDHLKLWLQTNHDKSQAFYWFKTENKEVFALLVKHYKPIYSFCTKSEWFVYEYFRNVLSFEDVKSMIENIKDLTVEKLDIMVDKFSMKELQKLFEEMLYFADKDLLKCLCRRGASVKNICVNNYLGLPFIKSIHFLLDQGVILSENDRQLLLKQVKEECMDLPKDFCRLMERIDYMQNNDINSKIF